MMRIGCILIGRQCRQQSPCECATVMPAFSVRGMSALGRFCCKNRLMACADNDSVALTRFAAEAGDDGAAEARAGGAFLRVPARRRGTGRSPGARDRCRARSVLGPR